MKAETLRQESRGDGRLASFLLPVGMDWLSVLLVLGSLAIVATSVERADWADTPSLLLVVSLAYLTGLLLHLLRLPALLFYTAGLGLGVVTVLWQASTLVGGGSIASRLGELFYRLSLWSGALRSGGISLDALPFAFGLVVMCWLLGFLAAWALLRRRNMWLALFPGTGGVLANLCYLPESHARLLFPYLLVAFLALARWRFVRWDAEVARLDIYRPEWLRFHLLHAAFWFILAALAVAFVLPRHGPVELLEASYRFLRTPIDSVNNDLSRLFAGLPARKAMPYKGFGPVFPFHGAATLSTAPVLEVHSSMPMYWRARSYSVYTSTGWKMGNTRLYPADWLPTVWREEQYQKRYDVEIEAAVYFSTQLVFVGGSASDLRGFRVESYDSPIYTIDLEKPEALETLPADVKELALNLAGPLLPTEVEELKERLPAELVMRDVRYEGSYANRLTLVRVLPNPPDFLAVYSPRHLASADTYRISASVSHATPEELSQAGETYPAWVLDRYLSLPPTLPSRVKVLAQEITLQASTPYNKAAAIAEYLRTLGYNVEIDPPPYDADGVDYFLFTIKEGYCDYFASAMTVMLRAVGVPARLAVGYLTGEKIENDLYLVRHSDSHAWTEVYFPSYGWVPFEATPGREVPLAVTPQPSEAGPPPPGIGEEMPFEEEHVWFPVDGGPAPSPGFNPARVLPWMALPLLLGLAFFWFWRRVVSPPVGAEAAFRRLVLLASLAGTGPHRSQTPYEYARALEERLPDHQGPLKVIAEAYVRNRYGRKALSAVEQAGLAKAWIALRRTLIFRILRMK